MEDTLGRILKGYRCITGQHTWYDPAEAAMCCRGYVRVFETLADDRHKGGCRISRYILVPAEQLQALDAMSSTGGDNPWLSNDM